MPSRREVVVATILVLALVFVLACSSPSPAPTPVEVVKITVTATPRLATATPVPTSAPTVAPKPTQTPEPPYMELPDSYPYTMKIPSGWRSKVSQPDYGSEHQYTDPRSDRWRIVVTMVTDTLVDMDSEGLADEVLGMMEGRSVAGSFSVTSRATLPDGTVKVTLSYQERGICDSNMIALAQVMPKISYIVEVVSCKDRWDEHEGVLREAIASFVLKP